MRTQPAPKNPVHEFTWNCHCCAQVRPDKLIKVRTHDISALMGADVGTAFVNCRYCADVPLCAERAASREWVVKRFVGDKLKGES